MVRCRIIRYLSKVLMKLVEGGYRRKVADEGWQTDEKGCWKEVGGGRRMNKNRRRGC